MALSSSELVGVHAVAGPLDQLIDRRRATYDAAVELASHSPAPLGLTPAVIDHPVVRAHLADVLSGTDDLDPGRFTSVDELVSDMGRWLAGGHHIRVASTRSAPGALSGPIRRIDAELGRRGADLLSEVVLHDGVPGFAEAARILRQGLDLALHTVPALAADLLPHVALFALLDRNSAGRLGSASAREYPGLIVLPAPASPLEAAEAFIHEGAHQKLFDLGIVGSLFAPDFWRAPTYRPSWAAPGSVPWPFEQTVAAFHAYSCLAALWQALDEPPTDAGSLLRPAAGRAAELGEQVDALRAHLGADGQAFLDRLHGRPGRTGPADTGRPPRPMAPGSATSTVIRHCGSWTLSMRWPQARKRPAEIVWTLNSS